MQTIPASSPGDADKPVRAGRSWTQWASLFSIIAIHVATIVAFVLAITGGVSWGLIALAAATYVIRMFAITGVYHRYFSHRTYKTSRAFQFFLALLGASATQKGPLWWGSTHRHHHKHSDDELDPHSPLRRGFVRSHMTWWLSRDWEKTDEAGISDFAKYPELRWLDKYHYVGPTLLIAVTWLIAGGDGILWGYAVSTFFLMHATFTINSLSHVFGSRRFATTDTSRNNALLAMITMGEGWHNNHHHYMSSARQGFYWWEIDATYYILWTLSKLGLVWDLRPVPKSALERNLLKDVGERAELLMKKNPAASDPAVAPVPVLPVALADAE